MVLEDFETFLLVSNDKRLVKASRIEDKIVLIL